MAKKDLRAELASLLLADRTRMRKLYDLFFSRFFPSQGRQFDMRVIEGIHYNGSMGASAIEKYLGVAGPSVSNAVKRLTERGHVRQLGSTDRRRKVLELTESGKALFQTWQKMEHAIAEHILHGIPRENRAEYVRLFRLSLEHARPIE